MNIYVLSEVTFSFQFLNLALGFGMSALEVMKLFLHFLCHVLKASFGITCAYLVQLDIRTEIK